MKKNRLLVMTFIYVSLYLFLPTTVNAYTYVKDECLDKNECMLVCNYNNTYEGSSLSGVTKPIRQRNISIYYFYSKQKWKIKWEGTNEDRFVYSKGPDSLLKIFSDDGKNVYTNFTIDSTKFTCPKYGYLDMSSLNADNELCFDNDGKYCESKSNVGTAFGKKATKFKSKKKDYDYADDFKKYLNNWVLGDISCQELAENSSNISAKVQEKANLDIQTNYLKGQKIPEFLVNNKAYQTKVKNGVEKRKKECEKEFDQQEKEGKIDKATSDKLKKQIANLSADDVQKGVDNAKKEIEAKGIDLSEYNQPQDCEGIFGDPNEPEDLAYLIQKILNYIKIIAPILVIILSSMDFIKVVWTSDDESMKKAQQKLAKRLVAAILLFLLPSLVELLFNLINESIVDPTCGIK